MPLASMSEPPRPKKRRPTMHTSAFGSNSSLRLTVATLGFLLAGIGLAFLGDTTPAFVYGLVGVAGAAVLVADVTACEARFRTAFAYAPNGVATLALDGTILSINPALCALVGHTPEELVGTSFARFAPSEELETSAGTFAEAARTGRSQRGIEHRLIDSAGREHWVDADVAVVPGATGAPAAFIVPICAVSERKAVEAEREEALTLIHTQNALLRAADEQKSELISMVSHDLRTPLTSIMGYVELLAEGAAGPLTAEQTNFLHIVRRSADRLLTLAEDLLVVSSGEAGRLQLTRVETDLAEIAAHAVEALRPRAAALGVALAVDAHAAASAPADATRIAEVLENLLSNALKFTLPGGSVDVRAFLEDAVAVIEVADTGVGIPADDHGRVFERFFRSKETGHVPGVGLGLSIVKAIVDAHAGLITVESEAGKGTVFRIELPAELPQPVPAPRAELATGAPPD